MKGLPRSLKHAAANAVVKKTVEVSATVTVSATGAAIGFGSAVIGDFPEGNILFLGAVAYVALAGSGADANLTDTWSGDYGIGTAPVADADLGDATDVDIIASTAVGPAVAEAIAATRGATGATIPQIFDNTDGSLELNLNVLIDAANIGDDQSVDLTATGVLYLAYAVMGDD